LQFVVVVMIGLMLLRYMLRVARCFRWWPR